MEPIPLVDLQVQQAEIADDIRVQFDDVLWSTELIGGPAVTRFEKNFAQFVGTGNCVGVPHGTDALDLALTGKTQAIVPVHLFGQIAPMPEIIAISDAPAVAVIEAAAQSQGARLDNQVSGSFGHAAATSFYRGKNLGAAGDAGAVTANSPGLAATVRAAKLQRLPRWNALRREAAARSGAMLAAVPGVVLSATRPGYENAWHLCGVQVENGDAVLTELNDAGIGTGFHYPTPFHLTKEFSYLGRAEGDFPLAEAAAARILTLPIFPHITVAQQEHVVAALAVAVLDR